MESSNGPGGIFINYEIFENEAFSVDSYVKKIASESIYASSIAETKDKLNRSAQETAEEIKQSVYKNYTNFMETAKEVGHLEGKMNQLRQSLDEQRKLLNLFKNLNVNSMNFEEQTLSNSSSRNGSTSSIPNQPTEATKSSLTMLLEQVEGCGLITQKPGRTLIYHSDLEALHLDDYSVSHKLHVYLLNDALLLTSPQRKRTRGFANTSGNSSSSNSRLLNNPLLMVETNLSNNFLDSTNSYQYKFQAFYELQEVKIMNIDDSKEVRNAFQLLKFPESQAFRCSNAHIKKEWLENIEYAKRQLQIQIDSEKGRLDFNSSLNNSTIREEDEEETESDDSDDSYNLTKSKAVKKKKEKQINLSNMSEHERNKLIKQQFSEFDILLAQRDFENAVETLLRIKQSTLNNNTSLTTSSKSNLSSNSITASTPNDVIQQLIYKQKETELINVLRKDLVSSKERGNSKGVIKTGKRVVNSLIKLKIYDQAIDLFIDYHKHLNAETLKKIKLEESNSIYMNNVLNLFFENLLGSFVSFKEAFDGIINYCYSSYITWCDTEIEILIKKLQSQHYLGRHFNLTIENCELIFIKAKQFSEKNNFEVKFLFETKLCSILETSIKEQQDVLIDASLQRSKLELEDNPANTEQNRLVQIDKLIKDIDNLKLFKYFNDDDLSLLRKCTSSCIQFSRGVINFYCSIQLVYYQDINFAIVEAFTKLFKSELKIYQIQLNNYTQQSNTVTEVTRKLSTKLNKTDISNNVKFVEKVLSMIEKLYFEKTGVHSKFLAKVNERYAKFRIDNF